MSSTGKKKVAKKTVKKTASKTTKPSTRPKKNLTRASSAAAKKAASGSTKKVIKKSTKKSTTKSSATKKTVKATTKRKPTAKTPTKSSRKTTKKPAGKTTKKKKKVVAGKKGAPPIPEAEPDGVEEEELAELQKEITKLQDKVDSTIDNRRHVDIKMGKLDRKVKMDKAIAIDQHHQKISQVDEMIEDIIDVLYDYEEQLETFSIYVDTSVAELFEDLKSDLNEEITAVENDAKDCAKVIPALENDLKSLQAKKEELEDELKERLSKQNQIKMNTDDLQGLFKDVSSEGGLESLKARNEKLRNDVHEDEALLNAAREGALGSAKGADPAVLKKLRSKNARLEIQIAGLNSLLAEASAGLSKTKNIDKLRAANERLRDHQEELEVLLADAAAKLKTTKPEVMSPSTKKKSEEQMLKLRELRDQLGEERNRKKELNKALSEAQKSDQASGGKQGDSTVESLELRKKLADLEKKLSDAKKNAKKKRRQSAGVTSPPKLAKSEANSPVAEALKERARLKREIKRMRGILAEETDKTQKKDTKGQKKLEAALEAEQQALDGRKERLAEQKEKLAELESQAEAGSSSLGALEEKYEGMEQKIKEINATKDERVAKIDELRQKVNRMKKRGRSLKKLGRNFERQIGQIKTESAKVKKVMKKHVESFTPFLKEQISVMRGLVKKQKEDYKDAKSNFEREHKIKMKLQKKLENDFDVPESEFKKLEDKVDHMIRKDKRHHR